MLYVVCNAVSAGDSHARENSRPLKRGFCWAQKNCNFFSAENCKKGGSDFSIGTRLFYTASEIHFSSSLQLWQSCRIARRPPQERKIRVRISPGVKVSNGLRFKRFGPVYCK
jgi:hypothetical protein